MPLPEAIAAIERFRRRLLQLDSAAAAQLVQAYGPIWQRLESDIQSLTAEILDKQMSIEQVRRLGRLRSLQDQVAVELTRYANTANGAITAAQRAGVALSQESAQQVVNAALPRGISTRLLAEVGIEWNILPAGAFESFVGIAGDGAPLSQLLAPLGAQAQAGIIQGIGEGIALGKGPRETAGIIRNRFGMPLTRSLLISRTETLRAYREATRAQYQANSNIVRGYRRHSAKDPRVCMACVALDGTLYRLDEPLNEHPGGRCALVPETITYKDLGLDVAEDTRRPETASEWFDSQPEATQRKMMGDKAFEAWQDGEIQLPDLVKITHNDTWGDSATVKPLKELV